MRIAVVANTAWYLYNFRVNLMQALGREGHAVVAIAPHGPHADRIQAAGIQFEPLALSPRGTNPWAELKSVLSLRQTLARLDVDMVLTYTPKGNLYAGLAVLGTARTYVPNVSGLGRLHAQPGLVARIAELLYGLAFRRALQVFFQNQEDLDLFVHKRLVQHRRAERLPGSGVDLVAFAPVPLAPRDPQAPVFLLVARLLWAKGIGEFVEAARAVRAEHPKARFQLLGFAGTGNEAVPRNQLDAWVEEGCIEFLGATDDVRRYIELADCVTLPSWYREGVPRALLEAAAMGRPIITTDMPGCRDTVIDGKTGFLCRPRDGADFTSKLLQFIELPVDERQAMGTGGRQLMEHRFDEQDVIQRYLRLVQRQSGLAGAGAS